MLKVNKNLANQIELSDTSFDKAWENHKDHMLLLLGIMNMDIDDIKKAKDNEKYHREELRKAELHVVKIEKKMEQAAEAKKAYWSYPEHYAQEEMKKHPRKYKTKMVEEKKDV